MNKKFATVLAATCVLGAATAFAANPFSDVTPNDWAYQSVAQLAAEGVIDGYPDGTFQGERNITRYEMAQMVARAMAREDQANAEQQAQIDRLAAEFANELNSLGVRVTNLEDRVGNVKVGGDMRLRVKSKPDKGKGVKAYYEDADMGSKFDSRLGLDLEAKVSEKTNVFGRLEASFDFGDADDANVELDGLYVHHAFTKDLSLTAGRYDVTLGATGILYDDKVDGATLAFDNDRFNLAAGYGSLKAIEEAPVTGKVPDMYYVQGGFNFADNAGLTAFYMAGTGKDENNIKFYGVGMDADFGQFNLHGDYVKNNADAVKGDDTMWTAGVRFGKASKSKVGSFEIGADYVDMEQNAYLGDGTTLSLGGEYMNAYNFGTKGAEFWVAKLGFVPFENSKLKAYYAFNAEDKNGKEFEDIYRVDLNYYF